MASYMLAAKFDREFACIVGCDTKNATKVYFGKIPVDQIENHDYIACFDENGNKVGEYKVIEDDGDVYLTTCF